MSATHDISLQRGVGYRPIGRVTIVAFVVFAFAGAAVEGFGDQHPNDPPGVVIERDLVYAARTDGPLHLDLYSPAGVPGSFGAVVLLHGERPRGRGRSDWSSVAAALAARGYVAAAIEYRTLHDARYPAAVDDVRAAIEWLRTNASTRGIAPDRIALVGDNFGGYLAALAALQPRSGSDPPGIQGVIAIHAPMDLGSYEPVEGYAYPYALFLGFPDAQRPDLWRAASPLTHVANSAPPFLLLHGTDDDFVPFHQSSVMKEALERAGAEVELVPFDRQGNGLLDEERNRRRIQQRINRFVDRVLWVPPAGVGVISDIVYASPGGRELSIDIYRPTFQRPPRIPAVLFFHGGGWLWGSHRDVRFLAARVAAAGFVTATVEYRLARERIYPAAVDDAKAAVRWMRANAGDYGVDGEAIGVSGISAGGHLAALLAVNGDQPFLEEADRHRDVSAAIQAAAPIAGVVDMPGQYLRDRYSPSIFLGSTPNERPEIWREASPTLHVRSGAPPFLFLHGRQDTVVAISEAEEMVRKLRAAGVEAEMYEAESGDHEFIHSPPWREPAIAKLIDFFERTLGAKLP